MDRQNNELDPMHKFPLPKTIDFSGRMFVDYDSGKPKTTIMLTIGDYILVEWTPGAPAKFNRTGSYGGKLSAGSSQDNITAKDLNGSFFREVLLQSGLLPKGLIEDLSEVTLTELPKADPTLSDFQQDAADRGLPVPGRPDIKPAKEPKPAPRKLKRAKK